MLDLDLGSTQMAKKILVLVIAFCLSLHLSAAKADFRQAIKAYQKQDYSNAFRLFKQQAEIGEVRSSLI
ncbi:MAG: hypothetical protein Q9M92_02665 [Enterobacterales bacterium]|nr:hypothetical protein [Enterobacterales bacterium]